jgi:chorismate mutase/SAM-dependent methyltransferase
MEQNLMTLEEIRDRLDLGDTQMLEWLATRANLVREVARIKEAKGASLQAADREASMFAKKRVQCRVHGLDFDYVSEIVSLMIWHSKQIECEELDRDTFLNTERVPESTLRENLLALTEVAAPQYDEYCHGERADAVSSYLDRELEWLTESVGRTGEAGVALDLGCATGQMCEWLQSRFQTVRGFDVSETMIEHARTRCDWSDGVSLDVVDLDQGIPVEDASVDFIVANFGVASELSDGLLPEISRCLKPGGRGLLSFYNTEALMNHWIYPWPATIHSHLNPHNDTLEVWSGPNVYTIHARGRTVAGVGDECASAGLSVSIKETYPTLQPILPNFIVRNERARKIYDVCRELDGHLAGPSVGHGTYIIAEVGKD